MNSVRSSQIALAVVVHLVLVARSLRDLDDDRVFHVSQSCAFRSRAPCAVGTLPQVSSETGPARVDRDVAFERQWLDERTWVDIARGWIADAPEAYDTLTTRCRGRRASCGATSGGSRNRASVTDTASVNRGRIPCSLETHRALQAKYGVTFDGFSLIWYRDGNDCQAFHRDRDMRFTENTLVVILTPRRRAGRGCCGVGTAATSGSRRTAAPSTTSPPPVATCSCSAAGRKPTGSTPCPKVPGATQAAFGRISGQWRWTSGKGRPELGGSYAAPRNFSRR